MDKARDGRKEKKGIFKERRWGRLGDGLREQGTCGVKAEGDVEAVVGMSKEAV